MCSSAGLLSVDSSRQKQMKQLKAHFVPMAATHAPTSGQTLAFVNTETKLLILFINSSDIFTQRTGVI